MKRHLVQLLQPDRGRSIHEPLSTSRCGGLPGKLAPVRWQCCSSSCPAAPILAPGSGLGTLLWQETGWGSSSRFRTGWWSTLRVRGAVAVAQ